MKIIVFTKINANPDLNCKREFRCIYKTEIKDGFFIMYHNAQLKGSEEKNCIMVSLDSILQIQKD